MYNNLFSLMYYIDLRLYNINQKVYTIIYIILR